MVQRDNFAQLQFTTSNGPRFIDMNPSMKSEPRVSLKDRIPFTPPQVAFFLLSSHRRRKQVDLMWRSCLTLSRANIKTALAGDLQRGKPDLEKLKP